MRTISREASLFIVAVVALATLVMVALADQVSWANWSEMLLFFGIMVIASSVRIPGPHGQSLTPSLVLSYLAMYTLNPPTAFLVIWVGRTLGDAISRGWVPWRSLFNGAQHGLSVAIGTNVVGLLGGFPERLDQSEAYLAVLGGPLVHLAVSNLLVEAVFSRWRSAPLLSTWLSAVRNFLWPNLLSVPSAVVLAILSNQVHFTAILVYAALLPLQWLALRLYVKRRQLYTQIVDGLVVATDVNFPLGRGHARRVADIAVAICREMRLGERALESIQFAALLHDVGMIGKDDLLERPALEPENVESLRDHVRIGAEIAKELPGKEIATIILRHHENYDGTGYPGGLQGDAIPVEARIISLAEAVDSMAFGMFPYSSSIPSVSIVSHVSAERGRTFDPDVVDAFLRIMERDSVGFVSAKAKENEVARPHRLGESPAR